MSELSGRVVLVTGAAGALGRAVVEHFAAEGAKIAQLDVIEIDNGHFSATPDLTDPVACKAAVETVRQELGPSMFSPISPGALPWVRRYTRPAPQPGSSSWV